MTLPRTLGLGSLGISLVVLLIKGAAYQVTGSVALLSDALESVANVATALAALAAFRFSAEPADQEHPYGHQKAECLSAFLVGVLIVLAGLAILREAHASLLAPKPIAAPWLGLAISSVATLVNSVWSTVLIRQGHRHNSPFLVADGKHLRADVVTSIGVVAGVGLVVTTDIPALDAAIAGLVALHVLWRGWKVVRENSGSLLDEAAPEDQLAKIQTILANQAKDAIEIHKFRARAAGRATFIDFHLVVPGDMTVARSHEICDRIEGALMASLTEALVTIHVEPDDKAEHGAMNGAIAAPTAA